MPPLQYQLVYSYHSSVSALEQHDGTNYLKDLDLLVAPARRHASVLLVNPERPDNFAKIKRSQYHYKYIVDSDWVLDCIFKGRILDFRGRDLTAEVLRMTDYEDMQDDPSFSEDDVSVATTADDDNDELMLLADGPLSSMPRPPVGIKLAKAHRGHSIRNTPPALQYTQDWLLWFYDHYPNATGVYTAGMYTSVLNKAFSVDPPMKTESVRWFIRTFKGYTDDFADRVAVLLKTQRHYSHKLHADSEIAKYLAAAV